MNKEEEKSERLRLDATINEIKIQLQAGEQTCNEHQHSLRGTLNEYWQTGRSSTDEAQLIETMNRQRALSSIVHSTTLQLRKMLNSPYFGRIDFIEEDASCSEQFYIGIASLTDTATGDFLVYDWRAPVSSMFYDFGRGKAAYECPVGTIAGEIILKRQYKISNGILEYMFDSDLKIDDEILQQILSRSADDKMHTIVNSIQREQNEIIRDQTHRVLFVEGPAGSGKTSVALHRIAFLLYQDREKLSSKNVLILSPNHIFSDYISNVLPEIGEENVLQITFQDLAEKMAHNFPLRFETRASYLEKILSSSFDTHRAANVSFKSSKIFEEALINYSNWLKSNWVNEYPAIIVRGEKLFDQKDWRRYWSESFKNMPPALRFGKIRKLLQTRMRPITLAIREEKETEIIAAAEEVNKRVIKAKARLQAWLELKPVHDLIGELTTVDPVAEYLKCFEVDGLFKGTPNQKSPPRDWEAIKSQTAACIKNGLLLYEDIPPFLYFQGILFGFPIKPHIRQLVIDEAQDYTAFQYRVLTKLFPNCAWTIVGDPEQAVQPFLQTATFAEANKIINQKNTFAFRLNKSYRSTKEILTFCQSLLKSSQNVESVNRPGQLPRVASVTNSEELTDRITLAVKTILDNGHHSIAIIAKNATEAMALYPKLSKLIDLALVTSEDDSFNRKVVLIPAYLAKGLEFDAVIVVNANARHYSHLHDRHILYTVCTRALHLLYLFYQGSLSPFLSEMDSSLYTTKLID